MKMKIVNETKISITEKEIKEMIIKELNGLGYDVSDKDIYFKYLF